jgi:hypothetical protein
MRLGARVAGIAVAVAAAAAGQACTETESGSTDDVVATDAAGDGDAANKAPAASAPASSPAPSPGPGVDLAIGPTADDDLKSVLYDALKAQLQEQGRGNGVRTVPGDIETFEFSVVKLTRGDDDVTNDPRETPDGVEVEISGWLQKTLPGIDGGEEKTECASFDTGAPVRKTRDGWALPAGYVFKFTREDAEDCY